MRSLRLLAAALALSSLSGCWGSESTAFPTGLEPRTTMNEASYPVGDAADPYPERLEMVLTYAETVPGRPPEVHARGYVHAPIETVWTALRNPDVSADRRSLVTYTVEEDVEPEFDFSYRIHGTIQNVVTFEYTSTFRHGVIEGTLQAPITVAEAWRKTEGSTIISDLRGSALLHAVEADVTAVELIQYVRAPISDHSNTVAYLQQVFGDLVALSHGQPLPPVMR